MILRVLLVVVVAAVVPVFVGCDQSKSDSAGAETGTAPVGQEGAKFKPPEGPDPHTIEIFKGRAQVLDAVNRGDLGEAEKALQSLEQLRAKANPDAARLIEQAKMRTDELRQSKLNPTTAPATQPD